MEGFVMQTFKRICIKDFLITAENGDRCEIKRGREYITSAVNKAPKIGPDPQANHVTVFTNFWVAAPVDIFAGEHQFTEA
jgi:hypothetical protein